MWWSRQYAANDRRTANRVAAAGPAAPPDAVAPPGAGSGGALDGGALTPEPDGRAARAEADSVAVGELDTVKNDGSESVSAGG
jgi:hypothetical protein